MKIGFDAKRAVKNRTGLGNYSRFIVRLMTGRQPHNDFFLYVPDKRRMPYLKEMPERSNLHLRFPLGSMARKFGSVWRSWGMTADLDRDGIDIYHGLSNELPLNIDRARCRSVVTIHDLIFKHCPEYYHLIDRLIYDYKFRRACRKADRVIAVSEYT
ncbi:MAG: glycosyltransferase [Prevotella sp.]